MFNVIAGILAFITMTSNMGADSTRIVKHEVRDYVNETVTIDVRAYNCYSGDMPYYETTEFLTFEEYDVKYS